MSEPIWNQFLTERDKAVFAASGYGARGGFGKRPALLVIDVNWAFCGDRPEPILESSQALAQSPAGKMPGRRSLTSARSSTNVTRKACR